MEQNTYPTGSAELRGTTGKSLGFCKVRICNVGHAAGFEHKWRQVATSECNKRKRKVGQRWQ